MLNLYSQTTFPVSASSAITRSCSDGPRPDGFCTYTRLPITIGAERPPNGTRHRRFAPLRSHEEGSPVSVDRPSRFAPRASGQSPSATRRGPCAHADVDKVEQITMTGRSNFSIGFRMLLEYVAVEKVAYERLFFMIRNAMRPIAWTLLLTAGLAAQSHRGALRGRVQDASGAAIVGAAVTGVNEATNETRTTVSGDAGGFAL